MLLYSIMCGFQAWFIFAQLLASSLNSGIQKAPNIEKQISATALLKYQEIKLLKSTLPPHLSQHLIQGIATSCLTCESCCCSGVGTRPVPLAAEAAGVLGVDFKEPCLILDPSALIASSSKALVLKMSFWMSMLITTGSGLGGSVETWGRSKGKSGLRMK